MVHVLMQDAYLWSLFIATSRGNSSHVFDLDTDAPLFNKKFTMSTLPQPQAKVKGVCYNFNNNSSFKKEYKKRPLLKLKIITLSFICVRETNKFLLL